MTKALPTNRKPDMHRMPAELDEAPCVGAEPSLFDATTWRDAQIALTYCARCPLTDACRTWVIGPPQVIQSHGGGYDGVAGGLVWRAGTPVGDGPTRARSSVQRPVRAPKGATT